MKRLLVLPLLLIPLLLWSQDEYSTAVTYVSDGGETLTLQSMAMSEKKKDATTMAVRSAFYTLLYRGVSGYNDGKPLLQHENKYYSDKLLTTRYPRFVKATKEMGDPVKEKATGQYKATVEVTIFIKVLIGDMVFEKVMDNPLENVTMADTKKEIGLPSITVVPYKRDEETYKAVLQNDFDRRIAVARVQQGFDKRGATTVDFEGKLEAAMRSSDFNGDGADSNDRSLLQSTGADVYVVVDIQKDINQQEGSKVSLIMKAYETASGNVLASRKDWTNRFHTSDLDQLCVYAVEDQLDAFLDDIALNFARAIKDGSSVVLHITQGSGSKTNLNTPVGGNGTILNNAIRRWVRSNAQDGRYHIQGIVAEEMIFDDIKIPSKDADGLPMDAAQFGDNLLYYLNDQLKVRSQMKLDGRTIYIILK